MSEGAPTKRRISRPRAVVLFSMEAHAPKLRVAEPPPAEQTSPRPGQPRHVPPCDRKVPRGPHEVGRALASQGFEVSVVNVEDDIDRLMAMIATERPDVVFNLATELEETTLNNHLLPACLDLLGIAYTGSDPLCLASCLDRVRSRLLLRDAGVPVPRFATVRDVNAVPETEGFRLPMIVTQAFDDLYETEGAQNPVYDWDLLVERVAKLAREFDLPFLIEEYVGYRRLHVVVLGNRTLECLPITETELPHVPTTPPPPPEPEEDEPEEVDEDDAPDEAAEEPTGDSEPGDLEDQIFSEIMTATGGEVAGAEATAPPEPEPDPEPEPTPLELDLIYLAQMDEDNADRLRTLARKAFRVLGCRDYAMVDFHLDDQGNAYVTDVRPMFEMAPGFAFSLAAAATDRGYQGTLTEMARIACRRAGMPEAALLSEQIEAAPPEPMPAPVPAPEETAPPESDDDDNGDELDDEAEADEITEDEEVSEDEEAEDDEEVSEDEEAEDDEEVSEDEEAEDDEEADDEAEDDEDDESKAS